MNMGLFAGAYIKLYIKGYKSMREDFVVFILSNRRAGSVTTLESLHKSGYTGKWYIIVDNEDDTIHDYVNNYGEDHVIVFDKKLAAAMTDTCENSGKRNGVVFARNVCFDIAKDIGVKYFVELDDDYVRFEYRYEENDKLMTVMLEDFDSVVDEMIEFLESSGASVVAFSQGGDFIGGVGSQNFRKKLVRKVMNTFFCSTDRPFKFFGLMNDDVNTYTTLGQSGALFLTYTPVSLVQGVTQQVSGGLTDIYLTAGTYQKSFYSVMCCPSAVKIATMGDKHPRMHHIVNWETCVPKIISDKFRKIVDI